MVSIGSNNTIKGGIAKLGEGRLSVPSNFSWAAYWAGHSPSDLVLIVISDTSIQVDWTDAASAADGIRIYVDGVLNGTAEFGDETYTITGLTENTEYTITIVAYRGENESPVLTDTATPEYWYLSGLVTPANCLAAYKPLGAANLAASYVNIKNPGTYDATTGEAPAFDPLTGWKADGASVYLKTGIIPTIDYTMIVLFHGAVLGTANVNSPCGSQGTLNSRFGFMCQRYVAEDLPLYPFSDTHYYISAAGGTTGQVIPGVSSGVMALTGYKGFLDGVNDATLPGVWTGVGKEIYLCAFNANGTPALWFTGYIQAVAIYNTTLTDAQIISISKRMAGLMGESAYLVSFGADNLIGEYGCWGVPKIGADPNNVGKYIITSQKYTSDVAVDENVVYSKYDLVTNAFTALADVFDSTEETVHQGHPSWGYWGGKYHVGYCQSSDESYTDGKIVDLESVTWEGFAAHVLSPAEPPATAECGLRPPFAYLIISDTSVWLFYDVYTGTKHYIAYAIWDSVTGWDETEHRISETELTSTWDKLHNVGTIIKEGDNIFVYYGNRVTKKLMVVQSTDNGATWEAPADTGATGCGISARPMVRKYGDLYIMVYNTISSIKIAKSTDGLTFTNETIIKTIYSYFTDYVIIDDQHIEVIWPLRDAIGEGGSAKNNIYGSTFYLGNYLTT